MKTTPHPNGIVLAPFALLLIVLLPGCLVHAPTGTVLHLDDPAQPDAEPTTLGMHHLVWSGDDEATTVLGRGQRAREHQWHVPLLSGGDQPDAHRWIRLRPTGEAGRWHVELSIARSLWPGEPGMVTELPATRRVQLAGEATLPPGWPRAPAEAELDAVELRHLDVPAVRLLLSGSLQVRQQPGDDQASPSAAPRTTQANLDTPPSRRGR